MMLKRIILPSLLLLLIACNSGEKKSEQAETEQWIQLFNGKDLDDWIIKIM